MNEKDRNQLRNCSYNAGIGDKKVQFRLGWRQRKDHNITIAIRRQK
ncbi:MAG: hypothetical protein A4E57_00698 [Syntrophorhabdaceae bacterium PtaU1.Bin034]|nr:MAG: hypothetical protein A4E57_00698 [Syntrophorhabdaceae bacterium PtaU1.Bin034]